MLDHVRYGVFLRPDPRTCAAVTAITGQLRAQYGLVSAGRFPPHATLAGSLPLAGDPAAALDGVIGALGVALRDVASFPVANAGLAWLGGGLIYDIHPGPDPGDDAPNRALVDLAAVVQAAVRPLLADPPAGQLPADLHDPGRWHGHLSLASHDLVARPDLRDEVLAYTAGLGITPPARFTAEIVALHRLVHGSWSGPWWTDFTWQHVRSWSLR